METVEEIESEIRRITVPGFRERLVAKGLARAMVMRDGQVPVEGPIFSTGLPQDLLRYGFSLLRFGLHLRDLEGDAELARSSFERAAESIEAVVRNGSPRERAGGFYRICAASAYHLAGYSARAFSLMRASFEPKSLTPAETALAHLMLRSLGNLLDFSRGWLEQPEHTDEAVGSSLADPESAVDVDEALQVALTALILRALAVFCHGLRTGKEENVTRAQEMLSRTQAIAGKTQPRHFMVDQLYCAPPHHRLVAAQPAHPPAPRRRRSALQRTAGRSHQAPAMWQYCPDRPVAFPTRSSGKVSRSRG